MIVPDSGDVHNAAVDRKDPPIECWLAGKGGRSQSITFQEMVYKFLQGWHLQHDA